MTICVNGEFVTQDQIAAEEAALKDPYVDYMATHGETPDMAQLCEWAEQNLIEAVLLRQDAVATQPVPAEKHIKQELVQFATNYAPYPENERAAKACQELQCRRYLKQLRATAQKPNESELRAYYDTHQELQIAPEQIQFSHLCLWVDAETRMTKYLELMRIKGLIERKEIAWEEAIFRFSDTFRKDGGLFDTLTRASLPPELAEKLFSLADDEISEVIDFGNSCLHIMKVKHRIPETPLTYVDVKAIISKSLHEIAIHEAIDAKADELKAKAVIERQA